MEDFLRHVVNALARSVLANDIVITYPRPDVRRHMSRMANDVHVLLDAHGLIVADQGPLHHIIALTMTV